LVQEIDRAGLSAIRLDRMERLEVIFVGQLWKGSTALQRACAFRDLGHHLEAVTIADPPEKVSGVERVRERISAKLFRLGLNSFGIRDLAGANARIIELVGRQEWDVLWLDKAMTIEPETLLKTRELCPKCIIVGYSPDDMHARHNQSRQFLRHLPLYDVFFTTKSYGVKELEARGCPRVRFVGNAFDPNTHKPWTLDRKDREALGGPVGFIGTYESDRAASMDYLARQGCKVRIWGSDWGSHRRRHPNMILEKRALYGDDYAKAIAAFDINLSFLRKMNRDLQTQRSVEVPACGAFMLAERTDEHRDLFEEGKEAEFFSSNEELLEKVRYYLAHPQQRKRIAAAARERCLKSGYSYHDRIKRMLEEIGSLGLR